MAKRKFYLFWFSPFERKIVRPEINVEIGAGMQRVRENMGAENSHAGRIDWELESTLPQWATSFRNRRAISLATISLLFAFWAISISDLQLGWAEYSAMSLALIGVLGLLNYSLYSLFDLPDEKLDERLLMLRNKYSFKTFQVLGLLILCLMATLDFLNIEPSRMWLPAIATYASIPYLLMAWQEKDFS